MTVLEERGRFWWSDEPLPAGQFAPDESISGLLVINDHGRITLELDNYFPIKHGPFSLLTDQRSIPQRGIAGVLKTSNSRVRLIGVSPNGAHVRSAGMSYQRFTAFDCLVGDSTLHETGEAPLFIGLEIDLSGFDAWFWFTSIEVSCADDHIVAEWRKPEPAVYRLDDETLTIEFDVVGSIPYSHLADEIALKERATLRMSLTGQPTLEQLRDRFKLLEDLLILLIDTEQRLKWPMVLLDNGLRARWYFARLENHETAEAPERHTCLTFFPHLRESFGDIWTNWKAKREQFGPGFYLYLGTRLGSFRNSLGGRTRQSIQRRFQQ